VGRVPSIFISWLSFSARHYRKLPPVFLVKFKGRRIEEYGREWVKHGWSNNGRRGRDGGGKGRGSTPRGVPSNFSAVVAPMGGVLISLLLGREFVGG